MHFWVKSGNEQSCSGNFLDIFHFYTLEKKTFEIRAPTIMRTSKLNPIPAIHTTIQLSFFKLSGSWGLHKHCQGWWKLFISQLWFYLFLFMFMWLLSCSCKLFSVCRHSCLVGYHVLTMFQPDGFTVVARHPSMDSTVFLLPSVLWGYKPQHDGVTLGLIMVNISVKVLQCSIQYFC